MNRDYQSGVFDNINFFVGNEIEHTPAYGMKTLFVVGVQDISIIKQLAEKKNVRHIFFGANHSYHPDLVLPEAYDEWKEWDDMIEHFLKEDYWCTLDIPLTHAESFLDGVLVEYDNFIPQLRVPLPYIKQWNYNTMLKLDDKDFKATNPGVWTHSLHKLMDRTCFNNWEEYTGDEVLDDNN